MAHLVVKHAFESVSAGVNPYLDADKFIKVSAVLALQKKVETWASKAEGAKTTDVFYVSKKIAKYSASLEKKGDHTYLVNRAAKVVRRARPATVANPKQVLLLTVYKDMDNKVLAAEVKKAVAAITQHNNKAPKVTDKVKVAKGKIRDEANAEFDSNLVALKEVLTKAGIKDTATFEGKSMFGKTVFLTLPNGGVITINKSSKEALAKAKAAARKLAATTEG